MNKSKETLEENKEFINSLLNGNQNFLSDTEREETERIEQNLKDLANKKFQERQIDIMSHPLMGSTRINKENLKDK